jgi:hypothetical protein
MKKQTLEKLLRSRYNINTNTEVFYEETRYGADVVSYQDDMIYSVGYVNNVCVHFRADRVEDDCIVEDVELLSMMWDDFIAVYGCYLEAEAQEENEEEEVITKEERFAEAQIEPLSNRPYVIDVTTIFDSDAEEMEFVNNFKSTGFKGGTLNEGQ